MQPGAKSAEKRVHVLETMVEEDLRRTDARTFLVSGAVGHDNALAWQLRHMLFQVGIMNAQSAGYF